MSHALVYLVYTSTHQMLKWPLIFAVGESNFLSPWLSIMGNQCIYKKVCKHGWESRDPFEDLSQSWTYNGFIEYYLSYNTNTSLLKNNAISCELRYLCALQHWCRQSPDQKEERNLLWLWSVGSLVMLSLFNFISRHLSKWSPCPFFF